MAQTAVVRARVDEKVKDEAAAVLAHFGLTISDVLRMTLNRVAKDKAVPFELKVPNEETIAAMRETDRLLKSRRARRYRDAEELFDVLDKKTKRK